MEPRTLLEVENEFGMEIVDLSEVINYGCLRRRVLCYTAFSKWYSSYLGIKSGNKTIGNIDVYISEERQRLLNKTYYYSMIISLFENRLVVSCDNAMISYIENGLINKDADSIYEVVNDELLPFEYKKKVMKRMILNPNILQKHIDTDNLTFRILYMPEEYRYRAYVNDEIIGYCKISDFINGFANVVVYIKEEYRNKGIAKVLLKLMIDQSKSLGFELMYIVDEKNSPSVKLAESMGFFTVAEEIIITTNERKMF